MDIDNDGIISEEEALWFLNAVNDTNYSLDEVKHDESEGRAEDLAQLTGHPCHELIKHESSHP